MEIRNAMDKDDTGSSVVYEGNGAELVDKNSSSKHIILVRPGKPPSGNVYDKQQLFLQKTRALESSKIPKYVVSFDEKIYLLRCLERIHVSTFKSTPGCNSSGNIGIISTGISSRTLPLNIPRLAVECLLNDVKNRIAFKDMVDAAANGDSILGSISSSKSMVNILSSPLLYQLGALSSAAKVDSKSPVTSDVRSSPVKFVEFSPKNMKEMVKRHVYANASRTSSSSSSDKSSYSNVSGVISQGMLQCTWKHGLPSFVLSLDDLGEIYVANLHKIQSPDDKSMDYVYNFYSKPCGKRENEVQEFELDFVGMMKVSNSVILCPNNSETLETRFVLFGSGDYGEEDEPETLVHNAPTKKTIKGLRNKVANAIRTGHGPKKRIPSKHSSTRNVHESMAPNLELAAIIVKTHVENAPSKKQEIGGWGLKFLKKPVNKQTDECCCECSTSMNILVPRGYHGGPRARNDGSSCLSSIIDRWSLGGHCDCGGWDVGCPLTVLSTKPTMQENVPPLNDSADCKAEVDLFVKGSEQNSPIMKMTNIQEDLHNIHFHSSILSPLQCLSIATAIIHNRTNSLRPKLHT